MRSVWATSGLAGRSGVIALLVLAASLAVRDLWRRRLGVFTGLVWAVWAVLTLLVVLFGDLYFFLAQP